MTWGRRYTEAELAELLARSSVRLVQGPAAVRERGSAIPKDRGTRDDYARRLAKQIVEAGLERPVLEWAFDAQLEGGGRNWRFDLAWPLHTPRLAIEVNGAVHRIRARFASDFEKLQQADHLGWRVIAVSTEQVRDGTALELVRRVLGHPG